MRSFDAMSSDSRSSEGPTVRCLGGSRHVLSLTAVSAGQIPIGHLISTERRPRPGGKAALLMSKVF